MTPEEQRIYDAGYTAGFMDCSKQLHEQSTDQEPVCKVANDRGDIDWTLFVPPIGTPLYTQPQEATRKPLTDEPVARLWLSSKTWKQWRLQESTERKEFAVHAVDIARRAVEHEREACAKYVDHILKEGGGTWGDAIRARGEA